MISAELASQFTAPYRENRKGTQHDPGIRLEEHPGLVVAHDTAALIPAGYQGLLVRENHE